MNSVKKYKRISKQLFQNLHNSGYYTLKYIGSPISALKRNYQNIHSFKNSLCGFKSFQDNLYTKNYVFVSVSVSVGRDNKVVI